MEEGGDGDGSLAGRHLVTEAGKVLLRGCFRVIIGIKSGNPMKKSLSSGTKFVRKSEAAKYRFDLQFLTWDFS